jgi:hypothetical protein
MEETNGRLGRIEAKLDDGFDRIDDKLSGLGERVARVETGISSHQALYAHPGAAVDIAGLQGFRRWVMGGLAVMSVVLTIAMALLYAGVFK